MEEGPITHPGVPEDQYHTLGEKTFWLILLEHVHAAAVLLVISGGLFFLGRNNFGAGSPFTSIQPYVMLAFYLCLALFILTAAFTFVVARLVYTHYKFYLGDDSLKIKRGILNKEEIAIPYRQIQDVDIERNLYFQALGLSRIIILTAGQDGQKGSDSEGVLPAIDKDLAEWLQGELLKRANVQKVVEEGR